MAKAENAKTKMKPIFKQVLHGAAPTILKAAGKTATLYAATISRDLADQVVEYCNPDNRDQIRQGKVIEYQDAMDSGHWRLENTLCFTDLGEMIDGQHRMLALRASKVEALPFLIEVVPSAQKYESNRVKDSGSPRNLADYLGFNAVPVSNRAAPVLVLQRNYNVSGGNPFQQSPGTKLDYLHLYTEITEEPFKQVREIMPRGIASLLGVSQAIIDWFALALVIHHGPSNASVFLELLMEPSELKKTDPPYILHERFRELKEKALKAGKSKDTKLNHGYGLIRGFNAYWRQERITKATLRYKGPNVEWPKLAGIEE